MELLNVVGWYGEKRASRRSLELDDDGLSEQTSSSISIADEPPPSYPVQQADDSATVSLPPDYAVAARPLRPITYTFRDLNENTVLLVPPARGQPREPTPLYWISTSLNAHPFIPLSVNTTIRRGGTAQGAFVGSFEIGISSRKYTKVRMSNRTAKLSTFLTTIKGAGSDRHWLWSFGLLELRWDCRKTLDDGSPLCVCYHGSGYDQLATLVPPSHDTFTYTAAVPTLTVYPDGHGEYFDHILLSGLAVQKILNL